MNSRTRRLVRQDARLRGQHLLPAGFHDAGFGDLPRQSQEDLVVAKLGEKQAAIEVGKLSVAGFRGEDGKTLA